MIPFLLVLITEVEEAWRMEQKLHQVVRDQQHQAQSVEAKETEHGEGERDKGQLRMWRQKYQPRKALYNKYAGLSEERCELHSSEADWLCRKLITFVAFMCLVIASQHCLRMLALK